MHLFNFDYTTDQHNVNGDQIRQHSSFCQLVCIFVSWKRDPLGLKVIPLSLIVGQTRIKTYSLEDLLTIQSNTNRSNMNSFNTFDFPLFEEFMFVLLVLDCIIYRSSVEYVLIRVPFLSFKYMPSCPTKIKASTRILRTVCVVH